MANRSSNGRFQKGQSGNPAGRPPLGDSLAEQIRLAVNPEKRKLMLDKMIGLAADAHDDPRVRIQAAEWIAKHGWPEESKGWSVQIPSGEGGPRKVIIELKDGRAQ